MAGQGLGILSQAVGQATSTALSIAQQEANRRREQAQVDTTNTIISEAIDLGDKMTTSGKTPFVVQRDIFKHISRRERSEGLPTGTAMSSYKQFFSASNASANGADAMKGWTVTQSPGGIQYTNPDGTGQKFIPHSEQKQVADAAYDDIKVSGDWITNTIQRTAPNLFNDPGIQTAIKTGDRGLALQNETFNRIVQMESRSSNTKKNLELLNNTVGVTNQTKANTMRQGGYQRDLIVQTQAIAKRTDITLVEKQKLLADVVLDQSNGNLDSYKLAMGELPEQLKQYLTQTDPQTKQLESTMVIKDRAENTRATNAFQLAQAEANIYNRDYNAVYKQVQLNKLKNVSYEVLQKMMVALGDEDWTKTMRTLVGQAQGSASMEEFNTSLDLRYTQGKDATLKLDEESFTTEVRSPSVDYIFSIIQKSSKGIDRINTAKAIEGMRTNKKQLRDSLEASLNYVDQSPKMVAQRMVINNFIGTYLGD